MPEKFSVFAKNGMVVSSQPLATVAGVRILMEGGNAIDAAVATAAVLGVVAAELSRHRQRCLCAVLFGQRQSSKGAGRKR